MNVCRSRVEPLVVYVCIEYIVITNRTTDIFEDKSLCLNF